jgi:two-component system KDP operon response regulator KdpE
MNNAHLRILIVDDEPEIRRFLRAALKARQYEVFEADTGQSGLAMYASQKPDMIILDLGLPDLDGIEVTKRLREAGGVPIIILSVHDREFDKIDAIDAGADDYLTKPFGIGELLARIRAVMRRVSAVNKAPLYHIGDLDIQIDRRYVSMAGKEIALTPTEFDLLRVMAENPGKVITHRQLIHQVWGSSYEDEARLLRVNISNLRRKIEPDPNRPEYILTELGVGYRFRDI